MPRKSSKTAHVMNLLAGDGGIKEADTSVKQEELQEKTAEHNQEPVSPEPGAGVSDTSAEAIDPVAEMIKTKLEEEMEQSLGEAEPEQKAQEPQAAEAEPEQITQESQAAAEAEPEQITQESQAAAEAEPEQKAAEPQAAEAKPEPDKAELAAEEPTYQYINVMEKIVNDEVMYFMREFNMCTCDRCVADTKALALTSMPSKYIVREKSQIPPLMNFYANKFIGYVTVELTKACTIVKETPHHDR